MLFLGIGLLSWLGMARIVRGQTLTLKNKEFIEAARASGVPTFIIIIRHIVPNLLGIVAVYATLLVPEMILTESFISFLGLGVQEPQTSLGALISEGAQDHPLWHAVATGASRCFSSSPPCSPSTSSATACATRLTRRTASMAMLEVNNLAVSFATNDGTVNAVNGVSFTLQPRRDAWASWAKAGRAKASSPSAIMGLAGQERHGHRLGEV